MFLITARIWFRRVKNNLLLFLFSYGAYALGFIIAFILFLYIYNETQYNKCYSNYSTTYRVVKSNNRFNTKTPRSPFILSEAIRNGNIGFKYVTSFCKVGKLYVKKDNQIITETGMVGVDPDFIEMFSLKFIKGFFNQHLFKLPYNIIISKSTALKYFNSIDVLDKFLEIERSGVRHNFIVVGVFEDLPENSTIRASILVNNKAALNNILKGFEPERDNWDNFYYETYVAGSERAIDEYNTLISQLTKDKLTEEQSFSFYLQPIIDIYLGSEGFINDFTIKGDSIKVTSSKLIMAFILLAVTLNFIIFNTASTANRYKEFGLKKLVGASNKDFLKSSMIEIFLSATVTFMYVVIPILIIWPLLVNKLFKKDFLDTEGIILVMLVFILILIGIGIIINLNTLVYLKEKKIINVISGALLKTGRNKNRYRKVIILFQTSIFIAVVLYTITVHKQTSFALSMNPGFNSENLLIIRGDFLKFDYSKYQVFKEKVKQLGGVISVSASNLLPPINEGGTFTHTHPIGKPNEKVIIESLFVDYDFVSTIQANLIEGRVFSEDLDGEKSRKYIVTTSAVKLLEMRDPLNSQIGRMNGVEIVGVVEDIQIHSVHKEQLPVFLSLYPRAANDIVIRLSEPHPSEILNEIKSLYSSIHSTTDFSIGYYDQEMASVYEEEILWHRIILSFGFFSIFIVCLGVIGLSFFILNHRTKEVGIRKIFGASFSQVLWLLYKEFLFITILAFLIITPVTIHYCNKWLEYYPRHISIGSSIILTTLLITLMILLISISYKGLKVAYTNPANALRHE